jgi:hypothetical protein
MLVEADPSTFFFTAHYKGHPLVLVRPEKLDLAWAKANLIRVWRAQAPKRVLRAYDAERQRPKRLGANGSWSAQADDAASRVARVIDIARFTFESGCVVPEADLTSAAAQG